MGRLPREPYYQVSPSIWLEGWTDDARLLAFYILTNRHRSLEGLFFLPLGYVQEDMGWDGERVVSALKILTNSGFVRYDEKARVMLILNALKRQAPGNPNHVKSAVGRVLELPDTELFAVFYESAKKYCKPLANALLEAFPALKVQDKVQDKVQGKVQGYSQPWCRVSPELGAPSNSNSSSNKTPLKVPPLGIQEDKKQIGEVDELPCGIPKSRYAEVREAWEIICGVVEAKRPASGKSPDKIRLSLFGQALLDRPDIDHVAEAKSFRQWWLHDRGATRPIFRGGAAWRNWLNNIPVQQHTLTDDKQRQDFYRKRLAERDGAK